MALLTSLMAVPPGPPCRLDDFLLAQLTIELAAHCDVSRLSKGKLRRLILAGAVQVDGRPFTVPTRTLKAGQRLVVRIDTYKLLEEKAVADTAFESGGGIVYADRWLLVANKPAGLPSDRTVVAGRDNLLAAVSRYLAADSAGGVQNDGGDGGGLWLAHRLDRETSGLVLFSRQAEVNKYFHELFRQRRIDKEYEALTGLPPQPVPRSFRVENRLDRVSAAGAAARWGSVGEGGQIAATSFSLLRRLERGLCLVARPETGRTHQIRVHLAEAGLPILGDSLYGGAVRVAGQAVGRVMLHAARLRFKHPADGRELFFEQAPPEDFQRCLGLLGATQP
ncbi:MAG: hypothetical protein A2087_07945 [Spirochaetes bacterium GWD1_61_31]|nr:MAG: hypothetical protein A2Y37_06185 [Spirochaetes bacterium GWB1_60_80]OHD34989.1 MAG: hypothetical protein A2004_04010 [Spirochaetes bacterium GWC1_61_12]OHD40466.1 MAG: hypothetical protein A2087_07945 [Spirochaetes bacterium GWD1_61_31]OHD43061.1 MAG: hypothetical protein A2Y35_01425 [Spirochaetes bacterium GWE1_60_18]OHD59657.1 MAG: hypothetical protein A2Y32_12305 [Spirochaetes bacterium GWF1_60_12]HAP44119.1 RluA family pseudouridine synthase [Spirochaetaceae bacterium]